MLTVVQNERFREESSSEEVAAFQVTNREDLQEKLSAKTKCRELALHCQINT
jgi:hypothetical protein